LAKKILAAFESMQSRSIGHLVEDAFMNCHATEHVRQLAERPIEKSTELAQADRHQLDEAVLELIGIRDPKELRETLEELHLETARHYRQVRIMEVQKQVERAGGSSRRLTAKDIAASIWDSLPADEIGEPVLPALLRDMQLTDAVDIPDGVPKALGAKHLFSPAGVDFRQGKETVHESYAHPEQAALVALLAENGFRGRTVVPHHPQDCRQLAADFRDRLVTVLSRCEQLAASRSGSDSMRQDISKLLLTWHLHGRSQGRDEGR
jgi:hypothetical protein